jgi:hypothetical protein
MGTSVLISATIGWMPSYRYFAGALRLLADEIETENPDLAAVIIDPIDKFPALMLDELGVSEFQAMALAARRAYDVAFANGVVGFTESHSRWNFLVTFSVLKALMLADPRAVEARDVVIEKRDGIQWVVPAWIADLVLELIAALPLIDAENPALARRLLASRGHDGAGRFDLTSLSNAEFCAVYEGVKWLLEDWAALGTTKVASVCLYEETLPYITKLNDLFLRDERVLTCKKGL